MKQEPRGVASGYLRAHLRVGDILDVAAPRGVFTLRAGDSPVLLVSAGIGATPVLAMLHALAAARDPREVWWLYGTRDGTDAPPSWLEIRDEGRTSRATSRKRIPNTIPTTPISTHGRQE